FYIHTTNISGNFATITWLSEQTNTNFIVQYGIEGQNPTTITTTNNTITLNMLNICSNYTVRIATLCGTDTSQYSTPYTFTTLGCCTFPQNITAIPISNNFHRIKWTPIFGALGYVVQYKNNTSTNWINIPTTDTTIVITALTPCTLYDYKVRTNCNGSISSDFSPIKNFTTLGCGACTDHTYCNSKGQSSATEWIADVQIGTWNNPSNNDNGYKDYGNISLSITRGLNYPIQLTPGFSVGAFTEYFKVWIDFNQNGTFGDDFVELIYDSQTPQTTTVNDTFTVPPTAVVGQTKMRVSMKYMEATSSPPTPCETFLFGEVEDYCLQISTDPIGYTTPSAPTIKTHWQQDILTIQCQTNNTQNQNMQITLININGQTTIKETIPTNNQNHQITTTHLPEGIYILQISNTQATYNWQQKITIIR
ncbi:MAG TPA: GEVED domain-containing protein, partial [Chitinophagales bacterium]|nr:GEVED domain-containing protein [Chitinophagales bacterium]